MKYKVVLTDAHQHPFDDALLALLRDCDASFEARVCETEQQVIDLCADADAVMTSHAFITERAIKSMRRCRIIARIGTGYDNVDDEAAGAAGIPVTNVPNFCTEEVATHTMAMLLAWARKLVVLDREVRRGVWQGDHILPTHRLSQQVLGLVGFGHIGRAVAARALPFGLRLIYYDPFYQPLADAPDAEPCGTLEELLAVTDFVSLHVGLNKQTRGMIAMTQFEVMKPSAVLINTSRGAVVVEQDLVRALKEKRIAGAAIDVPDPEPPATDHPLFAMDNVIWSPHCASHTVESMAELRRRAVEEVARALRGGPLLHVVNRRSLQRQKKDGA